MCWTVRHAGGLRVTSSSPLSRASSARAPVDRFFDDDVKKDMAPVFSCFVRSLKLKCEACYSKTRLQAQSATPRAMWHPRPRTDRRRPLQKGFVSVGKLTVTATGIAVDEKQLNSWARTNRPKKKKDRHVSFEVEAASRKKRK